MRIRKNNFAIFGKRDSTLSQEKFSTSQEKISTQLGKIQRLSGKNQHSVRKNSALLRKKSALSQEKIGLHNRHRTHDFPANFPDSNILPTNKKMHQGRRNSSSGMVPVIKPEHRPKAAFSARITSSRPWSEVLRVWKSWPVESLDSGGQAYTAWSHIHWPLGAYLLPRTEPIADFCTTSRIFQKLSTRSQIKSRQGFK